MTSKAAFGVRTAEQSGDALWLQGLRLEMRQSRLSPSRIPSGIVGVIAHYIHPKRRRRFAQPAHSIINP